MSTMAHAPRLMSKAAGRLMENRAWATITGIASRSAVPAAYSPRLPRGVHSARMISSKARTPASHQT